MANLPDRILQALEMDITKREKDSVTVRIPAYRVDVKRECDVVEDVLRIYGYNNIELPKRIHSSMGQIQHPEPDPVREKTADRLAAMGFREIMCNSLTRAAYYDKLQTYPAGSSVMILNPLSSDLNAMRQTLLWGGLEAIAYNINRQQYDLRFYEQGNVYQLTGSEASLDGYRESRRLALFITGNDKPQNWHTPSRPADFFLLKAYVESIARVFGLDLNLLECTAAPSDLFKSGIRYRVKNKVLADLGKSVTTACRFWTSNRKCLLQRFTGTFSSIWCATTKPVLRICPDSRKYTGIWHLLWITMLLMTNYITLRSKQRNVS